AEIDAYLANWRGLRPALDGDDLLRLGVPQGPLVGRLLGELRAARLDGLVSERYHEEEWVRRSLRKEERRG
ncbi:MAG: hypothetical protein HUU35_12200, partial [Armatimonadetes bacterium]|nr:hypothetical protein [Armatimonadota bacterium]